MSTAVENFLKIKKISSNKESTSGHLFYGNTHKCKIHINMETVIKVK